MDCPSSPTELALVKQQIIQMEDEIARALQIFHRERAALLEKLNAMQASIRSLLPEVFSHIFLLACDRESYQGQRLAHIIAGVCKHWRNIALSTPSLWSSLIVAFKKRSMRSRYDPLNLLQSHLERVNSNNPLSLTILFEAGANLPTWDILNAFSSLLSQKDNIHKVHTLRFVHAPFEWIASSFPPFPQLEYLGIYEEEGNATMAVIPNWRSDSHINPMTTLTLPVLSSPRLYRLEVRAPSGLRPFYDQNRLAGLTHISLSRVPVDLCISLLKRCPSLVQFEFSDPRVMGSNSSPTRRNPAVHDRIVLRHLQHFGWAHAETNERLQDFYKRVRFPHLKSFYWWSTSLDSDALRHLLPSLPSSLLLLKIHSAQQWPVDLVRNVCSAIPTVQKLHLHGCDFTTMTHFFSVLKVDGKGGITGLRGSVILLPQLRNVVMDGIERSHGDCAAAEDPGQMADQIVSTLQSRCHDMRTAFTLELAKRDGPGDDGWSSNIKDAYQMLLEEGIEIKIWLDAKRTRLLGR